MSSTVHTGHPTHIAKSQIAAPAKRVIADVFDLVLLSGLALLCCLLFEIIILVTSNDSFSDAVLLAIALLLIYLALLYRFWAQPLWCSGQTPGMKRYGIKWVRWSQSGAPVWCGLLKRLLQLVIACCTLCIANVVIYRRTLDDNGRFWFDRISDIAVVEQQVQTSEVEKSSREPQRNRENSVHIDENLERTHARVRGTGQIKLILDTGERIILAGTVLLGRSPVAAEQWKMAALVPVADPDFSISKTHLAVQRSGEKVLVQDLGSTNGTSIILPSGEIKQALPGVFVEATAGATVCFGMRKLTIAR